MLKCLPWKQLDVRLVLIETNKYRDLRPVDMFFSAHGYVNASTSAIHCHSLVCNARLCGHQWLPAPSHDSRCCNLTTITFCIATETFLYNAKKGHKEFPGSWLDNLYVKMPGGTPLIHPPGKPACNQADRKFHPDCDQWRDWARPEISDGWDACDS